MYRQRLEKEHLVSTNPVNYHQAQLVQYYRRKGLRFATHSHHNFLSRHILKSKYCISPTVEQRPREVIQHTLLSATGYSITVIVEIFDVGKPRGRSKHGPEVNTKMEHGTQSIQKTAPDWTTGVRLLADVRELRLLHSVNGGCGTHPARYPTGSGGSLPGDQAAKGRKLNIRHRLLKVKVKLSQ